MSEEDGKCCLIVKDYNLFTESIGFNLERCILGGPEKITFSIVPKKT